MALKFTDLPLSAAIQESLRTCGFLVPSPIQSKALPVALFGNDVIAQAKSGMGKTLVFGCVALELVVRSSSSWALILAPTREIALQIQHVLHSLIDAIPSLTPAVVVACIGGLAIQDDERHLHHRSARIVVGTPGRIKALVQRKVIPMAYMHLFVLDEVDKLMEADFKTDIEYVVAQLPPTKQIVACSATFTPEQLARLGTYMHAPQFVCVQDPKHVTTEYMEDTKLATWKAKARPELWLRGVRQFYCVVQAPESTAEDGLRIKVQRLARLLTEVSFHQCIVFCNDKYRAEALAAALSAMGYPAVCITGAQAQSQRTESMDSFRQFHARILVSTDLTARGIDIDRVNLVINLDLPRDPATYLHRVGRSGRFGGQGVAVTLLNALEVGAIEALAKLFQMVVAPWTGNLPPLDSTDCGEEDAQLEELRGAGDEYAQTDLPDRIFLKRRDAAPDTAVATNEPMLQGPLVQVAKNTPKKTVKQEQTIQEAAQVVVVSSPRTTLEPHERPKAIKEAPVAPQSKTLRQCPKADAMYVQEEAMYAQWLRGI
ncbi:Aste57867_19336 [Aphanomyces stellatus]|uniref:Aste57867_19336 protein n=1 Tax=Aphanomyces stellatus TaxID=120398 RepID=A0A485LDZ5_9STRA|nr:hypothetical protein As57867_019272 [Aphanomyces stellatus]VFT96051.1 Aste57867_19336 [Aphanomyces stellatus]